MARDVRLREGLETGDAKGLADIERHGWNVTLVFRTEDDSEGPEWGYSCGLFSNFGHPEIILFGLDLDVTHRIINLVGEHIKQGHVIEPGVEYPEFLEGYKCLFRPVDESHVPTYVGWASWFYEWESFPLLQLFWPDKFGRFPWESEVGHWLRNAQPFLFVPKKET